jgi:hypothetical protein
VNVGVEVMVRVWQEGVKVVEVRVIGRGRAVGIR